MSCALQNPKANLNSVPRYLQRITEISSIILKNKLLEKFKSEIEIIIKLPLPYTNNEK